MRTTKHNASPDYKTSCMIIGMYMMVTKIKGKLLYITSAFARGISGRGQGGEGCDPRPFVSRHIANRRPGLVPILAALLAAIRDMCVESDYQIECYTNNNQLLCAFESGELEEYGKTGKLCDIDGTELSEIPWYLDGSKEILGELFALCKEHNIVLHVKKHFLSESADREAERDVNIHMADFIKAAEENLS